VSGSLTREEVQAYETQVRHLLGRLAQTYGPVTLDRIWNAELPHSGQVGDIRFWFHGTGDRGRLFLSPQTPFLEKQVAAQDEDEWND
jgi:hypothetical protein